MRREHGVTGFKILIVDDHWMARDAIRTAIQCCDPAQHEIVGEAVDGASALELARQLRPDVITMDIGLPDINGLEVTRILKAELPQVRVVMVTMHEERAYREEAVKAGAASYVAKANLVHELPDCLAHLPVP